MTTTKNDATSEAARVSGSRRLADRTPSLSLSVEANAGGQAWAWVVHQEPDRMVLLRSQPEYTDRTEALEAGGAAAAKIGRRLGILIVDEVG